MANKKVAAAASATRRSDSTAAAAPSKSKAGNWELNGLLREANEDDSDNEQGWKKYAKLILPHVGLFLISCIYVVVGALVFYKLEQPNEVSIRTKSVKDISSKRDQFLQRMWTLSNNGTSMEQWNQVAEQHMESITKGLFEAFDNNYVNADVINRNITVDHWSFTTALFFTATLLTTIGYGNLVPVTFEGRMFCICYGLFGVPLILITVADLGKFLSEHIIWLYGKYSSGKQKLRQRLLRWCACCRRRRAKHVFDESLSSPSGLTLSNAQAQLANNVGGEAKPDYDGVEPDQENIGFDDYVSIPVSLVMLILLGYTALGALLLSNLEGWSVFDAFYFCFITMTTVGFGDLVPEKEAYFLLDLFYIVIGLAITTMCIDLVGVQYIRKIHYFGRAIQDARYALVNVGGKMIQVGDLMKYAALLHKKYGLNDPHAHIVENPLQRLFPHAYIPHDIKAIRYIDYVTSSDSLCTSATTTVLKNSDCAGAAPV